MPRVTVTLEPGELSLVRGLLRDALNEYKVGMRLHPSIDPYDFNKLMTDMSEGLLKKLDEAPELP